MSVTRKIPFAVRHVALAVALASVCGHAGATLVADGKLGGAANDSLGSTFDAQSEGYQTGWNVDFLDKNGKFLGTGQIWFGTDANNHQFIYYKLPETYVDNTYGTKASAGWTGGHTFNDLLGSDSMGGGQVMTWTDGNNAGKTSTARIDYIADCYKNASGAMTDASNCGAGNTSGYKSGGVGTAGGVGTTGSGSNWDKVDASLTGGLGGLLEIATSLEYDLKNTGGGPYTTNSPDLAAHPEWIKSVGYELEFAANTFNPATFGKTVTVDGSGNLGTPGLLFGDPHVSPPMGNTVATFRPPCQIGVCTQQAPEPSTPLLLAGGLAAMAWYARRRKVTTPAPDPLRVLGPS